MKKVMIGLLMVWCVQLAEAQTFKEWFEQKKTQINYYAQQIVALKAYSELLQKGYMIARDGLGLISDIKHGDFDLHDGYFSSLKTVNPSLRAHAATQQAFTLYERVSEQGRVTRRFIREQLSFTTGEKDYLLLVVDALAQKAKSERAELQLLTTANAYMLTDDERLNRIGRTAETLEEQYAFIKSFYHQLQLLAAQRQQENSDVQTQQRMHR